MSTQCLNAFGPSSCKEARAAVGVHASIIEETGDVCGCLWCVFSLSSCYCPLTTVAKCLSHCHGRHDNENIHFVRSATHSAFRAESPNVRCARGKGDRPSCIIACRMFPAKQTTNINKCPKASEHLLQRFSAWLFDSVWWGTHLRHLDVLSWTAYEMKMLGSLLGFAWPPLKKSCTSVTLAKSKSDSLSSIHVHGPSKYSVLEVTLSLDHTGESPFMFSDNVNGQDILAPPNPLDSQSHCSSQAAKMRMNRISGRRLSTSRRKKFTSTGPSSNFPAKGTLMYRTPAKWSNRPL